MKPGLLALLLLTMGTLQAQPPVVQLEKANVLPLALDDEFEFRKVKVFTNEPELLKPTNEKMLQFERQRVNFGAITAFDKKQRRGHYYTFFWRAGQEADITLRFEYRQANLGPYVLAKEVSYPEARGSYRTAIRVTGDEYLNDGAVTQWRALLVLDGRIVGLMQSYLWN